jgi:glycosyltransferase involved in cell wall biosynthesis
MKVLFYNHTGQVGGAERLLLTLLERLDRSEFATVLICPAEGQLCHLADEAGLRTETIDGLKARFTWRIDHLARYLNSIRQLVRQLRRKVIDNQPDLVHANSVRAGLVATLATIGLKQAVVWHIHDLLPRHPLTIIIRAIALGSRRTRIIAVAQASADRLTANIASLRRRTMVVPNAVDLDNLGANSARANASRIRRELQIERDAPLIGMIGRLTPAKGQLEMVKLFPRIRGHFPNARLVIVGAPAFNDEHDYQQLLKQTIAELNLSDRVHMLGARDDVGDILQALDLLVVNSASEACSLVLLEAMASVTPILATSTGGTPEIIEHETNGWLVTFGEEDQLLNGVTTMLNDKALRQRLSLQARQNASVRYAIPRFMSEMQAFYRVVLADRENPYEKKMPQFKVSLSPD